MKTAHNGLYIALNKPLIAGAVAISAGAVAFSAGALISMAFDKHEPYSRPLPPGHYTDFDGTKFTVEKSQ